MLLIRHAEKPLEGPNLSLQGKQRAAALVPYFIGNEHVIEFGTPCAIFAQGPDADHPSERPIETVIALAKTLNVPFITYSRERYAEMVAFIQRAPEYVGKLVLICWSHDDIPLIAEKFGAKDVPEEFKGFDRTWRLTYQRSGKVSFDDLPQKLMYGDSKN